MRSPSSLVTEINEARLLLEHWRLRITMYDDANYTKPQIVLDQIEELEKQMKRIKESAYGVFHAPK